MQAKREKVPGLTKQRPGTRRRRSNDRHPLGRESCAGRKAMESSFGGLHENGRAPNAIRPSDLGRPVSGKPIDGLFKPASADVSATPYSRKPLSVVEDARR